MKEGTSKFVKSNKNFITKKVSGTSSWIVTDLNNSEDNSRKRSKGMNMNDVYDSVHHNIKNKVNEAIKDVKRKHKLNLTRMHNIDEDEKFYRHQWEQADQKAMENTPLKDPIDEHDTQDRVVTNLNRFNVNIQMTGISTQRGSNEVKIDPNSFKNIQAKHLQTHLPEENAGEYEALDNDEEITGYQLINEAFSDEDVIEDFNNEKNEQVIFFLLVHYNFSLNFFIIKILAG